MPAGAPTIEVADLARRFGDTWAVDGLTFDAAPGEVVALLGPNGAGKTTTVRLLNGVLTPDRGTARVLGLDPTVDGTELRRHTGVLTEAGGLDDRLTLTDNLVSHARIRGMSRAAARARAMEMLDRFGMAPLADRTARGLSTGERKRVSLARCLLHAPQLLFLDEPTSGLDPAATRDVLGMIGAVAEEEGATVVLCTHFLAEAERLCRRVAILERGQLLAFGRPEDLAAELWHEIRVDFDLGSPADATLVAHLSTIDGVLHVESTAVGLSVAVAGRQVIPAVVGAAVTAEQAMFSVIPRPPTLEDVYFAVTGRSGADLSGAGL